MTIHILQKKEKNIYQAWPFFVFWGPILVVDPQCDGKLRLNVH